MGKLKRNPYSTELAMLRDYLAHGFDVYEYSHMLADFYEERDSDTPPDWFDPEDPTDRIEEMSAEDKEEFEQYALNQATDAFSPSTSFFSGAKLVKRDTWLLHQTDDLRAILNGGLAFGHDDMRTLGLTTYFKNRKKNPGWNFAFRADSRYADRAMGGRKYGDEAVLFQSAGIESYHAGDEEEQVIFWGPSVDFFVPVRAGEDKPFAILHNKSDRIIFEGLYLDVEDWVEKNIRQYFKTIAFVR